MYTAIEKTDSRMNIIYEEKSYKDGAKLQSYMTYNENDIIIKQESNYLIKNKLIWSDIFSYDETGKLIYKENINSDGMVTKVCMIDNQISE